MSSNSVIIILSFIAYVTSQNTIYRLPEYARPTHYALTIETNMQTFSFVGTVIIDVVILQQTNRIVLHSKDLTINQLTVSGVNVGHSLNLTTDFLIITLNQNLAINTNQRIQINYNGTLGTENVGFYRASYINQTLQIRYLAVTHLEATNARRAFPCFDEPNYKATFQINLIRPSEYLTASNMERTQSIILEGNRVRDVYNTTERMSTYLIAFMVSDYEYLSTIHNSVEYRTFGRPELIQRGDGSYSLTVATRAIKAMENTVVIPYTLSTMDQVPVPNEYYKIGAMENWGMVTYREKYLMYNYERTTASEKQFITTIITHEFAHQWFGNLVTPVWWNYIWLNEGFATYFEMLATAQFEPTWQLMDQFVTSIVQRAMNDDALETSRPMTRNVESPSEIEALYDTIVYEKAGSVIRMVANFLGDTIFLHGLTAYLHNWQFENVNPGNLYAAWQATYGNGLNISNIMTSWETQSGYPVVTVTRLPNGTTILSQRRFLINQASHSYQTTWPIPLTWFTIDSYTSNVIWFNTQEGLINLNVNLQQWVIFNINQMGFYRVNYDQTNWQLIIDYLKTGNFSAISIINRAQLIDDSFNLARSGRLHFSIPLDIGSYIVNETEYVPIVTFTNAFSHLDRLFTGQKLNESVRNYGRNILEGYFNETGFIQYSDSHLSKLTKVSVLTWLCNLEHQTCRNTTLRMFETWINTFTLIQPDSQSFVFCNGIRDSSDANWELTLQRYNLLREDTQRTRIAQGLGCSSNQATLQRLLNLIIESNSVFNASDKVPVITSVYTNNGVDGVNLVLRWLTQNYVLVNERVGSISSIIGGVSNRITTNEQLTLFSNFINQNAGSFTPSVNSTITAAITNVNSNLNWINTTSSEIEDYLRGSATNIYGQIFLILCSIFIHSLYTYIVQL